MKFIKCILLLLFILVGISCKQMKAPIVKIENYNSISFEPLSTKVVTNFFNHKAQKQVLVEEGYYVWGLSVVKWEGNYHAYYSRWKKEYEHKGWMTHCEIAHAVSDTPDGPFQFQNVVLESKNKQGWDRNNAHNPYAVVVEGKICLYYIANDIRNLFSFETGAYPDEQWFNDNRKDVRNSQCIGVAIADNPEGPFERAENIVVKPDSVNFKKIAVNPTVIYKDGQYQMIMKGDDLEHEKPFRIQLVGSATKPQGPFTFSPKPVYAKAQTEDATFWYDKVIGKYYMVCHVMGKRDLALFSSNDGQHWSEDERSVFMKKEFKLSDGTVWKPKRVERPFVLTNENGQPIMIYLAVYDKDVNGNIAIPIQWNTNNQ